MTVIRGKTKFQAQFYQLDIIHSIYTQLVPIEWMAFLSTLWELHLTFLDGPQ